MAKLKGVANIGDEIADILSEYTKEVTEGLEEAKKEVAKENVKILKAESPRDTGSYAKGWRDKKSGSAYIIHNKTDYQLTHLLEKGHAKRGGGRVRAYPHIGRVEQKAIKQYEDKVEKVIRG